MTSASRDQDSSSEDSSPSSELVIRPSAKAVKKRWHSKVRTGCDMCKKRRVKCDELKPACFKCTRKGLNCPGYNPPAVRLFEINDAPEFDTATDKDAYNVFIERGSRIFAIATTQATELWVNTIPQIAHTYKAVRHAVIAYGSVQMRALQGERFPIPEATLVHRARAMQQLYKSDPSELPVEVMACCAMFLMTLDVWTGNGGGPEFHLTAVWRLLKEHLSVLQRQGLAPSREIQEIFLPALDWALVNSLTGVDNFPPPGSPVPSSYRLLLDLPAVGNFNSYTEALNSLDWINKSTARYSIGHRDAGIEDNISAALAQFRERLLSLSSVGQLNPDSPEQNALREAYLSANWQATKIMFDSARYPSESLFSLLHDADFEHIVASIGFWLAGEASIPIKQRIPNLGIIPPLFLVATKCRDSKVRHDAVNLLHSATRSERGWDTCIASVLARFIIEAEEMALLNSPPVLATAAVDGSLGLVQTRKQNLYVSLAKVDLLPPQGVIRIRYWEQKLEDNGLQSRKSVKVTLPYGSVRGTEVPMVDILSSKTLRAYGYSGIILMAPEIPCQCLKSNRDQASDAQHSWGRGFVSYVVLSGDATHGNPSSLNEHGELNTKTGRDGWFHWSPVSVGE